MVWLVSMSASLRSIKGIMQWGNFPETAWRHWRPARRHMWLILDFWVSVKNRLALKSYHQTTCVSVLFMKNVIFFCFRVFAK